MSEVKVDFKLSPGHTSFPPRGPAQVTWKIRDTLVLQWRVRYSAGCSKPLIIRESFSSPNSNIKKSLSEVIVLTLEEEEWVIWKTGTGTQTLRERPNVLDAKCNNEGGVAEPDTSDMPGVGDPARMEGDLATGCQEWLKRSAGIGKKGTTSAEELLEATPFLGKPSLPAVSYDDDIEILDVPTPSPDCAKAWELLEAGHVELIESVRKMEIQAHHKPARSG